jgi:hypothetical protein
LKNNEIFKFKKFNFPPIIDNLTNTPYELDPEHAQPATAAAAHTSYIWYNILTTSTSTPHDDDDDDDLGLY